MTTQERLKKLEREVAALRKCVRTQQMIIEDKKHQPRVVADVSRNAPRLRLLDESGNTRAILLVDKHGPQLSLIDKNGTRRAILISDDETSQLILANNNYHLVGGISVNREEVKLLLSGEMAQPSVLAGIIDGRPGLTLNDEYGKERALLIISEEGPVLALSDDKGKARVEMNAFNFGSGFILHAKDGRRVIWNEHD